VVTNPERISAHGEAGGANGPGRGRQLSGRAWSFRQTQLLDALERVFLENGFRHLTIGDLVDHLRCSRRTLYSLAPSKEELVLVVIDRFLTQMGREAWSSATACADPGDAIAAYLEAGVTAFAAARPAFTEDLESYVPTRQLYDRHLEIALRTIGRLVNDGIDAGVFRTFHPPLIAEILDACVERIRQPDALHRADVSNSQAIAELAELVRFGLTNER
jgi:AcrR family transcriptional regulator